MVDSQLAGGNIYGFEPWYAALMYQVTGEQRYATYAIQQTDAFVASEEALINANQRATVAGDSYLEVGPIIGSLAVTYDWTYDLLTPAQRTRWINYANQAVWNVWNYQQAKWGNTTYAWSGWSIDNPSNNYYYSFLRATMLVGLATQGENPQAQRWLDKFRLEKMEGQLFPTFNRDLAGGDPEAAGSGGLEPAPDLVALAVEAVFGIGFGVLAGLRRGGWFDATALLASLVVIAVPVFVLGFLAQFLFGVRWGIAPVTVGDQASFARLLLPGIVLGSVSFAYVLRLTRSAVAETAQADWVRTAAATGASRSRVVSMHILRNSLIPVVTFLGADLGALLGGAVVTEGIFNIHGVGGALYQAVTRQEAPTVVGIVTVLVLVYLVANLVVDLLYAALDPRIRYG